jgi:hypothetical protein
MYICKYFKLEELIYPELFTAYKNRQNILYNALDDRILRAADAIREFIATPITINNWHTGGNFKESGLRNMATTTGAALSTHKFGRGLDLKFNSPKWNPEKLREYMKSIGCFEAGFLNRTDDEAKPFLNMTRIEWMDNMTWFHMDVSNYCNVDRSIMIVKG